ncbi:MAG: DUF4911 domain-containing protein [Firmicutes bacterium HGW-Firmicutes-15]|nr:MAG: DUF4911 domain-containing protein [Firmicutes bacterium HGW-Firmicutes-15]
MLTKVVEAYDNLGIVSTLDQASGMVTIRVTQDTWEEMIEILHNLPFSISFCDQVSITTPSAANANY